MAAALTSVGPSRPDPATGQTYIRALTTPEQVLDLFNWGPAPPPNSPLSTGNGPGTGCLAPPASPSVPG
ncbi:hypothetical protein ACWGLP_34735 [Streptomyces lydicus]